MINKTLAETVVNDHVIRIDRDKDFINGSIDGDKVYSLMWSDYNRDWVVGSSVCLPGKMQKAEAYLQCQVMLFKEYDKIKATIND